MPASADDPQLDRAIAAALQQQEGTGETGSDVLLGLFPGEGMMRGCSLPQHCRCRSGQGVCVGHAALSICHPA